MRAEIEALNRCLYAGSPEPWNGAALAQLCRELEAAQHDRRAPTETGLPPLNPAA